MDTNKRVSSNRTIGIAKMNRNAIQKTMNATKNINSSINRLRKKLRPNNRNKKSIVSKKTKGHHLSKKKNSGGGFLMTFLYVLLILSIILTIFAFIFHYFLRNKADEISNRFVEKTVEILKKRAPQGLLDPDAKMGAPVRTEGPPDDTENPYLNLYGSPDAPGFSGLPGGIAPGYRHAYSAWGDEYPSGHPFWKKWGDRWFEKKVYDYNVSGDDLSRQRLNEYVRDQNDYIKSINERVKQINTDLMYSPQYIEDKMALKEIRETERELANQVRREKRDEPILPDQYYY
jgi:hypothetical protein